MRNEMCSQLSAGEITTTFMKLKRSTKREKNACALLTHAPLTGLILTSAQRNFIWKKGFKSFGGERHKALVRNVSNTSPAEGLHKFFGVIIASRFEHGSQI